MTVEFLSLGQLLCRAVVMPSICPVVTVEASLASAATLSILRHVGSCPFQPLLIVRVDC